MLARLTRSTVDSSLNELQATLTSLWLILIVAKWLSCYATFFHSLQVIAAVEKSSSSSSTTRQSVTSFRNRVSTSLAEQGWGRSLAKSFAHSLADQLATAVRATPDAPLLHNPSLKIVFKNSLCRTQSAHPPQRFFLHRNAHVAPDNESGYSAISLFISPESRRHGLVVMSPVHYCSGLIDLPSHCLDAGRASHPRTFTRLALNGNPPHTCRRIT